MAEMNLERKTRDALEKAIISVFLAEADAGKGPTEDQQFEEALKSLPEDQREAARAAYQEQKAKRAAVPDPFDIGTQQSAAMKKANDDAKAKREQEERMGAARGVTPLEQAEGQVLTAKQRIDQYGTGNEELANALRTLAFVERESGQKSQIWGTLSQAYFNQMGAAAQDLIIAAAASAGAPKASVPSPGLPRSETGKLPATGPSSPQSRPRPTQPQARTPVQTPGLKVSEPTKRETYKIEIQSTQPAPAAPTPSPFPTTIGTPKPEKVPTVVGTSRGGQTTAPPSSSVPFPTKPEMPNIPAKPYTAPATSVQLPTSQNQVMVAPNLSPVVPRGRDFDSTVQSTQQGGFLRKALQTAMAGVIGANATAAAGNAPIAAGRTPSAVVTSAPKATTTTTITPVVTTTPGKVNIPGRTPVAAPTQSARSTAAPSQAASARVFNFGAYLAQQAQQAQQGQQAQQAQQAQQGQQGQQGQQAQQAQKAAETAPLKSQGKEEVAQAQKQTQASKAEQTTKQTTSTASSLTQIAQNAITGVVSSIANQIINTPGKVGVGTPPVAPVPPIVPGGGEREKSPKQRSRPSFDFKATGIDPIYVGVRSNLLKQVKGDGTISGDDKNVETVPLAGYNRQAWGIQ
jgi:hypothetical protein